MTKSNLTVFFILFLLSLVIIFFNQNQVILLFKHYINEILRPFEIVPSKVRNGLLFWQSAFLNVKRLKESNAELTAENLELYGKLAKLSQLEEENSLLREQLNLSKKAINAQPASIIGRDFANNRSFVINKGGSDGLRNGMAVISKGETVVGRIIDTSYNTAKIQTILDTQNKIAAMTEGSRVSGLIRGLGSDIIFDLIAKNKKPEVGELIISSGTDGNWPRGLIVGRVGQIKAADSQVFNTINIEMLLNISELNDIFVILNNQ